MGAWDGSSYGNTGDVVQGSSCCTSAGGCPVEITLLLLCTLPSVQRRLTRLRAGLGVARPGPHRRTGAAGVQRACMHPGQMPRCGAALRSLQHCALPLPWHAAAASPGRRRLCRKQAATVFPHHLAPGRRPSRICPQCRRRWRLMLKVLPDHRDMDFDQQVGAAGRSWLHCYCRC